MKKNDLINNEYVQGLLSEYSLENFLKVNTLVEKEMGRASRAFKSSIVISHLETLELVHSLVIKEVNKFQKFKEYPFKFQNKLKEKIYYQSQILNQKMNEIEFKNKLNISISSFDAISVQNLDLELKRLKEILAGYNATYLYERD